MRTGRIKLITPEAFMIAFNRYKSNKNYEKEKNNDEDKSNHHPIV